MASSRIPFVKTATVSLRISSGFTASVAQFDAAALMNVLRTPVEVREIRIMVDTRPDLSAGGSVDATGFVYLEGKFGRDYITDGQVPISVVAPYRLQSDLIDSYRDSIGGFDVTPNVSVRRIILPKPLFVPPGKGFNFTASISADKMITTTTLGATVYITIAIVGRYLAPNDPAPKFNDVPMISSVMLTTAKVASLETDLRNPLSKDLRVRWFIGAVQSNSGARYIPITTAASGVTFEAKFPDSSPASEDPIDFTRELFGQMRVWPANMILPANQRIRTRIIGLANTQLGYQVALFGTRPEVVL